MMIYINTELFDMYSKCNHYMYHQLKQVITHPPPKKKNQKKTKTKKQIWKLFKFFSSSNLIHMQKVKKCYCYWIFHKNGA